MSDTRAHQPSRPIDNSPITVTIASIYAFVFSGFFLLYGGVKVVLSFLDHSYDDLAQPIIFVAMGLALLMPAFAFRDMKRWGYWGLVFINAAVVVLAAVGYVQYENPVPGENFLQYENLVVLALSGVVLYLLFAPATTKWLTKHR